jgi:hypothetical protein
MFFLLNLCFLFFIFYLHLLDRYFFTKWCYSLDINSFRFGSALNPDSSIRMYWHNHPWFFYPFGLCFAEYTVLTD